MITDFGIMLIDGRDNPETAERLLRTAGYGGLGGATGSATEFAVQSQLSRYMVARTLGGAAPSAAGATLFRGAGGAAGGGVASIVVETWQIATEEGPHSPEEVAAREGRALVIGATSGFLATVAASAATGALAGTVAPGVGNVIGFIVGAVVGIGVALTLEAAIPRPERTTSAGPDPSPSPYREPSIRGCFSGDTEVLLEDGRSLPIAAMVPGDRVRSYSETACAFVTGLVTSVYEHRPEACVTLRLEDGRKPIQVTPGHQFLTVDGWRAAAELQLGGRLVTSDLDTVAVIAVDPPGPALHVYDLSITPCPNYFAGGVLVHNKMF